MDLPARALEAVLTADVIRSTDYGPDERKRLDRELRTAFTDVEQRFAGAIRTPFGFRITAGDEFQCVISDVSKAIRVILYLRATLVTCGMDPPPRFRAAVGVGQIAVSGGRTSYEEDGEAFVRSRDGLNRLDRGRPPGRWTTLATGRAETDGALDAVLVLCDHLQQRWTPSQWAAIRWAALDLKREDIASRVGVRHQSVTKRLSSAGWHAFREAMGFVERTLAHVAATT